jgi:hypothetical protein
MAILGTLLKKGIILRESFEQLYTSPFDLQKQELRKLLIHAQHTEFGEKFGFQKLLKALKSSDVNRFYEEFVTTVPVYDYDKIYEEWWYRNKEGEKDITWPGKVKYFALSSGTSGSSSKYIPVTKDMLKSMRKTGVRQILSLSKYDLPDNLFTKGILMLGGSTDLRKSDHYFEGDLSGITTSRVPIWFQRFYKPGKRISRTDWSTKLDEITLKAKDWDIGIIVGVPAWLQILIEKIITHYQVKDIHEIWPNLSIFVHGGVPFEPYRKGFEKLLSKPLIYMETYLASEGFIAFQSRPETKAMKLVLNNGIFYEFIPFTEDNFTEDGDLAAKPETLRIDQIEEGKEYALLLSTNAGAWRYLIGDVIKLVSKEEMEIVITGRTKHFLSLCGEHLSLDNMNKAVQLVEEELNLDIREFTVIGEKYESLFAHRWFMASDDDLNVPVVKERLDHYLKELNDDYRVERQHALKEVFVHHIPPSIVHKWMEQQGKLGAQGKFPRVMKKDKATHWLSFLKAENYTVQD